MQVIAYREHDETDESPNQGKWKQFIETMVTNPKIKQKQDRLKRQYKHMMTGQNVLELYQSNGNESEYTIQYNMYTILIDECIRTMLVMKNFPPASGMLMTMKKCRRVSTSSQE